ncbi:MAG: LysR family transcriptional regulator [Clostridia bacterium]|nr:LysR family transcriptional regulator [Clostridia bacterium]
MLDIKLSTLLSVAEEKNFTKAAEKLSLTQPAVSHQISQLEDELGVKIFIRGKGEFKPTPEGETVLRYARRIKAMYDRMTEEISDSESRFTRIRVGITHTAESNQITEALAKYGSRDRQMSITIITDTIKNLYAMLENYELDLAIVESRPANPSFNCLLLDTDYLVCVLSNGHRLSEKSMVTLSELKSEQMILRLPTSATRMLFEAALMGVGESIDNFNVALEVDNIATIKDLIRKELGISILPKSACMDELKKGKLTALPIENLSMLREMNIVYNRDFSKMDVLRDIVAYYHDAAKLYD